MRGCHLIAYPLILNCPAPNCLLLSLAASPSTCHRSVRPNLVVEQGPSSVSPGTRLSPIRLQSCLFEHRSLNPQPQLNTPPTRIPRTPATNITPFQDYCIYPGSSISPRNTPHSPLKLRGVCFHLTFPFRIHSLHFMAQNSVIDVTLPFAIWVPSVNVSTSARVELL